MKRLLAVSVLALAVLATSQQSASAWCNFKFGVGLNLECQSGNNNLLWGAYRSGQVPSPYDYGAPPVFVPAPHDFHAPPPSPTHAYAAPQYYSPAQAAAPVAQQYSYPAATPAAQPYRYPAATPAAYSYPASYYPMSYPAGYYPMSFGYFGNYGNYNFAQ